MRRQGLSLVHFSAQPESFQSLNSIETTQVVCQKVLTSSRKVDECKPLDGGAPVGAVAARSRGRGRDW
jgi:hypothetical protein